MADAAAGKIYGEALFEAAVEAGRLETVQRDLSALGEVLSTTPQLARALFNPAFPEPAKRRIVTKVAEGADELVVNALLVLVDNGRLPALPEVIEAFEELHARAERNLEVSLTTAIPIDDAQAEDVSRRLAAATGQHVVLERRVDPAILGGVVLRIHDLLIDQSVRGRLEGLRETLRRVRVPVGAES